MNQDLTQELAAAQAELVASKEATARAEAKIAAVQAELSKPTPWERWRPKIGDSYHSVLSDGTFWIRIYKGAVVDQTTHDMGNCFPTREAAQRHAKRIRSMVPTCPVPERGDVCWFLNLNKGGFFVAQGAWTGSLGNQALYALGHVFALSETAHAWVDEFSDAWTTLEDGS